MAAMTAAERSPVGRSALAKVTRRLMPFLFLLYLLNFLDRVNVGFAALQMNRDLGFGPEVYGLGAGIFFVAYALFEVPSNLILARTGARIWIARIMISWGLVASAMMFVRSAETFYAARLLLGVAEAGFFPGIIYYLTYWYPARERARAYSAFLAAIPLSGIVGSPISGALLELDGVRGLAGWQWLFLLEGIPSVLVGVWVLSYLTDRPAAARWLTPEESAWLEGALNAERAQMAEPHGAGLMRALRNPDVWHLALIYFLVVVGLYGFALWLPQLVKTIPGLSNLEIGLITAIPYLVAAVGMVLVGARSDRTGERYLHMAITTLIGATGFVLAAYLRGAVPLVVALSVVAFGVLAPIGVFWSLPTAFLKDRAAAGGIAFINSVGALGGFVGPYAVGLVRKRTGSFEAALLTLAAVMVGSGIAALWLRARAGRTATASRKARG
jgi:ACS family tartrate transporter-like MFS transporter